MKTFKGMFLMITGVALAITAATAAEEQAAQAPVPGMDPALMKKMKTLMTPGPEHQVLRDYAGKWTYTGTFRMLPDAPPHQMTGTSVNTLVYGGRFLKQEISGPSWTGETFEGLGYTGYDGMRKAYQSVWMDSMGTSLMTASGTYDAASKTLNFSGENSCPLTGETHRKGRAEWKAVDENHTTYSSYAYAPDGTEFKTMELLYSRAE